MFLIEGFLTGAFHDRFNFTTALLTTNDCYSCLKLMIQSHLHIGFFKIFFIKNVSLRIQLIENGCNQAQFLNKEIIMKCFVIKIVA